MLVFFIHGVNTQNSRYADVLIKKIHKKLASPANFYSSFWGNLFNNKKHQTIGCIEKDFSRVCEHHKEYKSSYDDIYRYKKRRNEIINNFLGDFLIYQNPVRGKAIRKTIVEQLNQFLNDHSDQQEIHLIAHSLGSFILWDLIFSDTLDNDDPAFIFREKLNLLNLASITTLGSPLLFLKQMLDIDFSVINYFFKNSDKEETAGLQKLRWVNIIHSSDLIAYPLKAAIENEISSDLLFCDHYVWQYANGMEKTLNNMGQSDMAMVVGAEDAHSSYFYDNLDGEITSGIIAYNLLGKTQKLLERCVHPKPMG
ncbi:hypothetical protein [Nostoc sp. LEGE 12450]|uniref:hypothetical protein n=1 Tax=Nostoc sp. LEGE 12450 TaxID=1828643 RepID=UPI00187F8A4E|nr:hypothetical protein [Nostoc sp. LEGE 12450]MBE8991653.1 hypothetical protein [Nostoc sp. LEGE 12450]